VVIAGAYSLDPAVVAKHVLLGEPGSEGWSGLARLPIGTKILLRHPLNGTAGPLETLVADLCAALSIEVDWRLPEPGRGGLGTIHRDEDMVKDADAVVTYVDERREDEGGTVRLTRMAMGWPNKAVWSFAPMEDEIAFAGASDRGARWATTG
jgi:hypothetical protein